MGQLCCKTLSAEEIISANIDKQLKEEEKMKRRNQTLLLLGAGECGKTTILKQLNILHNGGYSDMDLINATSTVFANIIEGMATLMDAKDHFYYELSNSDLDADAQHIIALAVSGKATLPFSPLTFKALHRLWHDSTVQRTFERRAEFQMIDSLAYFMENLDRIYDANYIPTVDDMLRTRAPTSGIVHQTFEIKGTEFKIIDVGGQRPERRKWIHCFDNVNGIIFVSAISEYNQRLAENRTSNRLFESMRLFEIICNCEWFVETSMILFLNKRDLFEQKLKTTSINVLFDRYQGSNNYDECVAYIKMRFENVNAFSDTKKIYTHITCATDTNQIQLVIGSVADMVIEKHLRITGME